MYTGTMISSLLNLVETVRHRPRPRPAACPLQQAIERYCSTLGHDVDPAYMTADERRRVLAYARHLQQLDS